MADDNTKELTDEDLKGKGKLSGIIFVVLSLVLIGGGVGAGLFLGGKKAPAVEKKAPEELMLVDLEELYVNIAETQGTRILKLKPVLELSEEALKAVVEERIPLVRDQISEAACRMSVGELDGPGGRKTLKREIKNRLNVMLREQMAGTIKEVYFSEYLIQ